MDDREEDVEEFFFFLFVTFVLLGAILLIGSITIDLLGWYDTYGGIF